MSFHRQPDVDLAGNDRTRRGIACAASFRCFWLPPSLPPGGRGASKLHLVIANAVADPARPADSKAADSLRLPADTLAFSGVRPGMTVGEFYPGGGYYTRLLSDVVGPSGHVYGLENRLEGRGRRQQPAACRRQMEERLDGRQAVRYGVFPKAARPRLDHAKLSRSEGAAVRQCRHGRVRPRGVQGAEARRDLFILDHQGAAGLTNAQIAKFHRINRDVVRR